MAEHYCAPYPQCKNLDGRLLINQTLHGPSLALPGDIGLGDLRARGILRPFARFRYEQRWIPLEACQAPVRSIVGLAPGETMSYDTRSVEQHDYTRLVQSATEKSEMVTTSGPLSAMEERDDPAAVQGWREAVMLPTRVVDRFGSLWEIGGAIVGAAIGGPIGAGVGAWVGGAVGEWVGGGDDGAAGSGNEEANSTVDEILQSVTRSESQRTLTESTRSQSTLFERTISRTFTNPYKNRSLQLRFIPVFRRFEVITTFWEFQHGVVLDLTQAKFPGKNLSARLGSFIQKHVSDPRMASVATADLGLQDSGTPARKSQGTTQPLFEHLNANAEVYSRKYLAHLSSRGDQEMLQGALAAILTGHAKGSAAEEQRAFLWSRLRVEGKSLYLPMAGGHISPKALKMPDSGRVYKNALDRIEKFRNRKVERKREVHLFMGTHIEASPGECVLPDVPNL